MPRPRSGRAAEAAQRFADRRRREDDAQRLVDSVPGLLTLRLEVEDRNRENQARYAAYARPIMVDRAPALFFFPCGDTACENGGIDLTSTILRQLAAGTDVFDATGMCDGSVGNEGCKRQLNVHATATRKH